jgi:hypothetical protein
MVRHKKASFDADTLRSLIRRMTMKKKNAVLIGGIASLAGLGSAQAAVDHGAEMTRTMQVSSYSELLQPIPNAVELLKASDAESRQAQEQMRAQPVQYYYYYHHHHHHHHHHHYHHHHHHRD